jgi:hypothetical protein
MMKTLCGTGRARIGGDVMRFDPQATRDEILAALTDEARQRYGPERSAAQSAILDVLATSLWQVAKASPEPFEEFPDTLALEQLHG